MDIFSNLLGGLAAFLTTIANVPQVIKCIRTGESSDLSLKMLITLALGLMLWLSYGVVRHDIIIAVANGVSLGLVIVLLGFKWRDRRNSPPHSVRIQPGRMPKQEKIDCEEPKNAPAIQP
jgi:MtN3 and saliva related transmembrane protein